MSLSSPAAAGWAAAGSFLFANHSFILFNYFYVLFSIFEMPTVKGPWCGGAVL